MIRKSFGVLAFCSLFLFGSLTVQAVEVTPGVALDETDVVDVPASSAPVSPLEIPQPFSVEVTLVQPEVPEASPLPEPSSSPALVELAPDTPVDTLPASAPVVRDVQTLDPRPDNSVVSALISVLGEYTPATYETVTYVDGSPVVTTELVPGLAGLDWPWLASAGILALMLFCLFKLLGGLWK